MKMVNCKDMSEMRENDRDELFNMNNVKEYCCEEAISEKVKFKEIRRYCSAIDKVVIFQLDTMERSEYLRISDVPEVYDNKWLYGLKAAGKKDGEVFNPTMEIILCDTL